MTQGRLNRIKNPTFAEGVRRPTGWAFAENGASANWTREIESGEVNGYGVRISKSKSGGRALWTQEIVCRAETYYRIDATVRCALRARFQDGCESCGAVLSIQPLRGGKAVGPQRETPGILVADRPTAIRTYYRTPKAAGRLQIEVGIVRAAGWMVIESVGAFEILEPEEESHVLALPPPVHAAPAPRVARKIALVTDEFRNGELEGRLKSYFGDQVVASTAPGEWNPRSSDGFDALFMPDERPPKGLPTLGALLQLAERRIVVVSVSAFARLAGKSVTLRRVVQADDPIHARIEYAHQATRGYALHDAIPFASSAGSPASFVQIQIRKNDAFARFCKKHGFVTMLSSLCQRESTSHQPIGLFRETSGGGLYVLDLDALNEPPSTFQEVLPGWHLLLTMLGHPRSRLGQYTVPERSEARLRDLIRELSLRFQGVTVQDNGLPVEELTEQIVVVGGEDQAFGLPLRPRPAILIRSGLRSGDAESVYGAFLWIKQLVRMPPYVCPYAPALLSQFRVLWEPCVARWEAKEGWRRRGPGVVESTGLNRLMDREVAGSVLIDVMSWPIDDVRILIGSRGERMDRLARWLPPLVETFGPPLNFAPAASPDVHFGGAPDRVRRSARPSIRIVQDDDAFPSEHLRKARARGVELIRVEVPGFDADFVAHSMHRTDVAAIVLEHVVGLYYGLIAVNRRNEPMHFDGFAPVAPGEALIVEERSAVLRNGAARVG